MATHTSLASLFTAIADAIRAKTGGTAKIVADNFPTEIAALVKPSGTRSITANGTYDVTKYASANVNVPPEAPVLLWTNASPTSNFNAQTVKLSGAGYSGYIVECKDWNSQTLADDTIGFAYLRMGKVGICVARVGGQDYGRARPVSSVKTSGITFGNGYSGGGIYPEGKYCIPTRIWGVKFTIS